MNIRINAVNDNYILQFEYNQSLIAAIKTLPMHTRRWDPNGKVWVVHSSAEDDLLKIVEIYAPHVKLPKVAKKAEQEIRELKVAYIGRCKERNGESSAVAVLLGDNGGLQDGWNTVIPEKVLRKWFGEEDTAIPSGTLFSILGVRKDADQEQIRAGFRRMVKLWHPDVNKDPDAPEQFMRIHEAWSILGDAKKKARYLAGLALSASLPTPVQQKDAYRPPQQYGLIKAKGTEQAGRFVVDEILSWGDIYDENGAYMISTWDKDNMEARIYFIKEERKWAI